MNLNEVILLMVLKWGTTTRQVVQDTGYILNEIMVLNLDFKYHIKGPYSYKLDSYLSQCVAVGYLHEILDGCPRYILTSQGKSVALLIARDQKELSYYIARIKEVFSSRQLQDKSKKVYNPKMHSINVSKSSGRISGASILREIAATLT